MEGHGVEPAVKTVAARGLCGTNTPGMAGLLIAGIDEAGYGPTLGPLCVAMCAVRVASWERGVPPPDCWELLKASVARSVKEAKVGGRIAIADSKELKLSNDGARHPLTHLERGVMSWLCAAGQRPRTDAELHTLLGAALDPHACYGGEALALPVAQSADMLGIAANQLAGAMMAAGVRPAALACRVVGEQEFNGVVKDEGSKAQATILGLREHLTRLVRREAASAWAEGASVWVVCDRLGGRTSYAAVLAAILPEFEVSIVEQTEARSIYVLKDGRGREMGVTFKVEGEKSQLPVALASITAKYVRELAMARFNRHWRGLDASLKPTAGYAQDARRWLADAKTLLTREDRQALIRRA